MSSFKGSSKLTKQASRAHRKPFWKYARSHRSNRARNDTHFAKSKRRYFLFAPPPTPGKEPLQTISQPRARRAELVPGVARGEGGGNRSNWTTHYYLWSCSYVPQVQPHYKLNIMIFICIFHLSLSVGQHSSFRARSYWIVRFCNNACCSVLEFLQLICTHSWAITPYKPAMVEVRFY